MAAFWNSVARLFNFVASVELPLLEAVCAAWVSLLEISVIIWPNCDGLCCCICCSSFMKLAVGDRPKASVCCAAEETELELLVVLDVVLFGWKGLGNSEETGLIVTLS